MTGAASDGQHHDRPDRDQRLRPGARNDPRHAAIGRGTACHGHLLACHAVHVGGDDLPARQPAAARTADARSREAPAAGPLGIGPRSQPDLRASQPADPQIRPRHDVSGRPWPRRTRRAVEPVSGRQLQRDLPGDHQRRRWPAPLLRPLLVPRRHRQPLHAGNTRLDPRRRRTRLFRLARLRCRVRQSGPDRRGGGWRRRSGNRAVGNLLAWQQVS